MPNKVEMVGAEELRRMFKALPDELAREGLVIVQAHAEFTKARIQAAYPMGPTGNLKRMVTVSRQEAGPHGSAVVVRSRAPHAHLFEYGTKKRKTSHGFNRGRMPKAPPEQAMVPIVVRGKRLMTQALVGLLERAGFLVTF